MNFNKNKFEVMREELTAKKASDIKALGEAVVVPSTTEPKAMTCERHGSYETRLTPAGVAGLRATMRGEKPAELIEHRYCQACAQEITDKCEADKKAIDAQERDEIRERGLMQKIEKAGVSARHAGFTLEQLRPVNGKQDKAISVASEIIQRLKAKEQAPSLIIAGSVGTGKSLIAAAAVQSAIRAGLTAEMATVMSLIRDFRATWKKDCDYSEAEFIKRLTTVDVFALDEIGVQYGSDSEKLFVFDVIDGRYRNMLPTILISNLNLEGIKECVGERCVDRMREDGGKVVAFDFESQRGR